MAKTYEVTSAVRRINKLTSWMARRGIGRQMVLTTTGRRSGEPRTTPVSPLDVDGVEYLVCPYGNVDWVKNVRANAEVRLQSGKTTRTCSLAEVTGQRPEVVKAYYERERYARQYMDVPEAPTIEDFQAAATSFPVFRVEAV